MLKADVTKEYTKMEIVGTVPDICNDLSHMIRGIINKLEESDAESALKFKVLFSAGFTSGVVFGEDKEHMNHYVELGKDAAEKTEKSREEVMEEVMKVIDELKRIRDILKSVQGESEDEAE